MPTTIYSIAGWQLRQKKLFQKSWKKTENLKNSKFTAPIIQSLYKL